MKSISKILVAVTMLLSFTACNAKIKNAKTDTLKIYGNCEMCEKAIEKAGNLKRVANVDWNKDSKMAIITYDYQKTNQAEILKRIALAGYDSDSFLAPDKAYAQLPGCCQYERVKKAVAQIEKPIIKMDATDLVEQKLPIEMNTTDHEAHKMQMETEELNQLTTVFDSYFAVKDALIETDGVKASEKSKALLVAINTVKMDKLENDVHIVWMKVLADLKADAEQMADTKDEAKQRTRFMFLSKNIYALMKVSKYEKPVYYQFCPMANNGKGANWLSKENAVKNPYYGAQMLSCGKTVETIKK